MRNPVETFEQVHNTPITSEADLSKAQVVTRTVRSIGEGSVVDLTQYTIDNRLDQLEAHVTDVLRGIWNSRAKCDAFADAIRIAYIIGRRQGAEDVGGPDGEDKS